ncbi:hypothetical protein [Thermomonospora amylolytica]|uniref:hypothetical protein n=1 Tax=Thermomonospora amylolytica TaxID=1411117 RepID=UPI0013008ECD|nr:hypothetical protein [Thermomonospora amylolytica]
MIIEKVTGDPWRQEAQERIIEPPGLRYTSSMSDGNAADTFRSDIRTTPELDAGDDHSVRRFGIFGRCRPEAALDPSDPVVRC